MQSNIVLTPDEAGEFLHVSKRTLIRWRNQRIGPAWTRIGGKVAYQSNDLQKWLDAQRVEPVGEVAA